MIKYIVIDFHNLLSVAAFDSAFDKLKTPVIMSQSQLHIDSG